MNKLTFDPKDHQYKLDGLRMVSVTQVIQDAGLTDFSKVNPEMLERAANFGTSVHRTCQLSAKGTLDESNLDNALLPYLNQYKAFVRDFKYIPKEMEYKIFNKSIGVAGTIDSIGIIKGESTILDLKTGHPKPADVVQASAYAYLYPVQRVLILYITGEFYKINELKRQDRKRGEQIFLAALSLYNYKKQEGLL